jgi:hypothetical protein
MPSVVRGIIGRQTRWRYVDNTGPAKPEDSLGFPGTAQGIDETGSAVVLDGSLDTGGDDPRRKA